MTKHNRRSSGEYDSGLRYVVALWKDEDECCEAGYTFLISSNNLFIARSSCRFRKQQFPMNRYVVIDRKTGKVKIWRYFETRDDSYSYAGERINALEEAFEGLTNTI